MGPESVKKTGISITRQQEYLCRCLREQEKWSRFWETLGMGGDTFRLRFVAFRCFY